MGDKQVYEVRYATIAGRPVWALTRGPDRIFLRGVPPAANKLREEHPDGADVFVGDRFGWDGHRLHVSVDRLAEIVEALIAGQLPAQFVEEVQRKENEYNAPCAGG